jgi:hypothetical protein
VPAAPRTRSLCRYRDRSRSAIAARVSPSPAARHKHPPTPLQRPHQLSTQQWHGTTAPHGILDARATGIVTHTILKHRRGPRGHQDELFAHKMFAPGSSTADSSALPGRSSRRHRRLESHRLSPPPEFASGVPKRQLQGTNVQLARSALQATLSQACLRQQVTVVLAAGLRGVTS